jgi:hypothetical protein
MRIRLAIENTKQIIEARLDSLEGELLAIWESPETPLRRRELLFLRWDECDELVNVAPKGVPAEAISEIDAIRVAAADDARRTIERFIRHHAPPRHEHAYARDELRRLNAHRISAQPFSPYTPKDDR